MTLTKKINIAINFENQIVRLHILYALNMMSNFVSIRYNLLFDL